MTRMNFVLSSNFIEIVVDFLGIENKNHCLLNLKRCCRLFYFQIEWEGLKKNKTTENLGYKKNIAVDQRFLAELVEKVKKQEIILAGGVKKLEYLYESLIESFCYIDEIVRISSPAETSTSSRALIPFIQNPIPLRNGEDWYQVIYLNQYKGWGLVSTRLIPSDTSLMIYAGELISTKEMKRRYLSHYDSQGMNYILSLKEHARDDSFILRTNVDATEYGNLSRFLNHSCQPNCEIVLNRSETDSLLGIPILRTIHTIQPLEELTFDYGSSEVEAARSYERSNEMINKQKMKSCYCGSENCRKFLPSDLD